MLFMDELAYLRLYSARRKVYIPIDPSDRKRGAAIMLLTKDSVDSHTLMNLPFIFNPRLYESLYIDRNVNALIKSGMITDDELANEGEEPVNEAMMHVIAGKKVKVSIDIKVMNANDQRLVSRTFDEKNFLKWYRFFNTKDRNICESVTIHVYPNIKELVREHQSKALADKDIIAYSYSGEDYIAVVANSGYGEIKSKDGPSYEAYLLNELISFVCMRTSKRCSRFLAGQIATALSGQLTPELMEKIKNQWGNQKDYGLACAYVIKTMYDNDGKQAIVDLCKTGDINMLGKYAVKGFVRRISGIYEATLTSEQRKNMKDSDYGLPKLRKYPMPDESHVRSAIRFFNHVSSEDEAELARNIKKKIKQYNMSVEVGENNRFSKYYGGGKKKAVKETALLESVNIPDNKIAVGTDFHFIGYNDDKTKIIIKSKSYIEGVIEKENEIVGDDGIFIYLGDLFYKAFSSEYDIPAAMKEEGIAYAKRFKGKYKILIRGNHDNLPDEFYIEKCGFTHVCASLKYGNYLFTHQPEIVRDPIINIHGHIHGTRAYVEGSPKNHMDVWTINSKHIDSLDKVVAAQEAYDKTTKQAKNIDKADPYQHIQGENLNLEDIVTEGAIRKPFKHEAAGFESGSPVRSKVLFTKEITPESLARIYERHGTDLLTYAEKDGVGNRAYKLVDIDSGSVITRNNPIKRGHELELEESSTLYEVKFIDNKGNPVPRKCPSCGSKVGVFFRGEPVFLCTNRECNKYFGTVPFNESADNVPADWTGYYPKQTVSFLKEVMDYKYEKLSDKEKKAIKEIIDSLSDKEKDYVGNSDEAVNSKILYKDIQYINGEPAGFLFVTDKVNGPYGFVLLAVKDKFRNKGLAAKMSANMLRICKQRGIKTLSWNVNFGNDASSAVAKKAGFKHFKKYNKYDEYYYDLREAAAYHSAPAPIPGSDAERDKHFDEVMEIVDALAQNERDDIAINGLYTDSPNVIDRRIARDDNGNPIGFIDVYFFRSKPFECQLTAAIKPEYRGQGYMHKMLADIIRAAPIGHPGVTKYVWNVDPNNIHSIKLATRCGFRKTGILRHRDDLDIDEDRYEYVLPFKEAEGTIPLPQRLMTESFNADGYVVTDDYIMTEDFITFFNGMDTQVISEAEKKYDSKLKRYLYKERLKNNKAVLLRYQQMKAMNPIIKRTFLKLPMYRRRNIFIDLSFYHGLFLEHLQFKKDVAVKMYWDFLNRLIVDNEYKDLYKKITIFIPVWAEAWGTNTAEDLMDYRKSINPISMIIRMLRKNPTELKKWGNKDILFVSPQGYFKVNFNKFELKDLTKFRRFITKLVDNESIEEDEDEDGYTTAVNADDDTDSASVITAKIVDKLEKNTGVEIDDITGGQSNTYQPEEVETVLTPSKQEFTHLRVRVGKIELPTNGISKDGNQTKNPVKNAVLIMAPTGDKSADTFLNNQIAKNIITANKRGYFSP